MPGEHLYSPKPSLAYAKLTATPTDSSWSQVYNAGNLFACLSLKITTEENPPSLQTLGKELFNNLEAEFFTLEDKNLTTISDAIKKSTKHIPSGITLTFCVAYFKDAILYLFLVGKGKAVLKRGEKLGLLLENNNDDGEYVKTASGYLHNSDTLILETEQFAKNVPDEQIAEGLQLALPNDIAEALSVHMHAKADGDQAAIIIVYHGVTTHHQPVNKEPTLAEAAEETDLPSEEKSQKAFLPNFSSLFAKLHVPKLPSTNTQFLHLTHTKKLFLSIVIIIFVLLGSSIFLSLKKQKQTQTAALFQSIYTPAQKSYDEAKALGSLNPSLSHNDFVKAENLLKNSQNKFPKGSTEANQIADLLQKVATEIGTNSDTTSVKEVESPKNDLLSLEQATTDGQGFSQDADTVYYLTNKEALAITKANGKKKTLLQNNNEWSKAVSIVPYQGNLYILDQKNGILKYVGSSGGFSKSSYLKTTPDLSKAISMAIDSSIWVLFQDGSIKKYTRGEEDAFSIKGLTTPFANPTKIFTDIDSTNVYILDPGTSSIVKLAKDGSFQTKYAASILNKAKDFEVLEQDKKILFLANGKIWEITL